MTDSSAILSPEGWRVSLRAFGRAFLSPPYPDKQCATAAAEQQPVLLERLVQGDMLGGYTSLSDFLDKYVTWLGWEEKMSGTAAEQVALQLRTKQETENSKNLLEQVKTFHIYDQQGYNLAHTIIKDVKTRWKLIEAERKKITTPLYQAYKNVQALFEAPLSYYADVETVLKTKLLEAQARAKAAEDAALLAAQQASAVGDRHQLAVAMHQAGQAVIETPAGQQNRTSWGYEVTDSSLIPLHFMMVDHSRLGAFVRENKGAIPVPGVRQYEVHSVAVRT